MTHAKAVLAQLREGERDEDVPAEIRAQCRERVDELEEELGEDEEQ